MQQKFSRSLDELSRIVAFTERFFTSSDIDGSLRNIVDLCVEELFVNMVTYNRETQEDIAIDMEPHDHGVKVTLTDFDVERFDPRQAPAVDINAPIDQRTPGGLGLYLVLKMTDAIHYEYRDRISRITFIKERKQEDV